MKIWIFTFLFVSCGFAAFATQDKKTIKLELTSPTGNLSIVTVYFDQGISSLYNSSQDAAMVFTKVPGVPQFFGVTTDSVNCSILGFGDLSTTTVVPLGYEVGYDGLYTINKIELSNFDPTSIITLEDRTLGITKNLLTDFYQVNLDSGQIITGRFFIHVSTPVRFSSINSNCQNNGGKINVVPDSSIAWASCQLFNSKNYLLQTDTNLVGAVTFDSLKAGDYQLTFTYGQYTTTESFQVKGNFVTASIGTPAQPLYTGQDVVFSAITSNADQYICRSPEMQVLRLHLAQNRAKLRSG